MLLDCAAFVPTSRLDLSMWKPDFVAISFYKMFGYPTGLGALIARRRTLERLQRPWFSGGTVVAANVQGDMVVPHSGHALFEDGTVDYLGIPAVEIGLRHIERIGIDTISQRVESLGTWLLEALQRLQHSDGSPASRVYGPTTWDRRGGTIAFNFLHPDGRVVDERFVDLVAAAHNISVRTGCFCNPGAGEIAFSISEEMLAEEFEDGMILDDYIGLVGHAHGRRGPRVARTRDEFRGRLPVHGVRDGVLRRDRRAGGSAAQAGLLDAGRQPGVWAERLSQRRHQVAVDHVEEHVRSGVLAVEEPLERVLGQHAGGASARAWSRSPATDRRRSGSRTRTPGPDPPARLGCGGRRGR